MAPQLPQQSTESLGDFLLEGLSRPYRLYGAADFADLGSPEDPWVSMPPRGAGDTADEPWPDGRAVKQGLAVVAASTVAVSQHTNKPTHDA
jgi:hypothetical protein